MIFKKEISDYISKFKIGAKIDPSLLTIFKYKEEDPPISIEVISEITVAPDALGNRPLYRVDIEETYSDGKKVKRSTPLLIKKENGDYIIVRTLGDLLNP